MFCGSVFMLCVYSIFGQKQILASLGLGACIFMD